MKQAALFNHWPLAKSLCFAVALSAIACRKQESGANVKYTVSENPSTAEITKALQSTIAFRVNLTTNRISYFNSGKQMGQWNIVTADTSGEFHDGITQATPPGIFRADLLEACPTWYPSHPKDDNGKPAETEQERWAIFEKHKEIYGACGEKNPLGKYAIWFNGPYALHGNAAEWVLELPTADERRASGGCVRNPNAKIKYLFDEIFNTFPELKGFADTVRAQASGSGEKRTLTQDVTAIPITVVVGSWPTDPKEDVGRQQGGNTPPAPQPQPQPQPQPTQSTNTGGKGNSTCAKVKVVGGSEQDFWSYSRASSAIDYAVGVLDYGSVHTVLGRENGYVAIDDAVYGKPKLYIKESSVKCL
jgi:hypothetical protein